MIVFVSALLIVGFFSTTIASYMVSKNVIRDALIHRELPITSDNVYSEVQRDLLRPVFISSLMAQDTFLRDWVMGGEKNISLVSKYLNEIKQKYHTFTSFLVAEKSFNYYYSGGILKKVREDQERDRWYFRVRKMKEPYEINVDPDMANKDTMTIFINYKMFDYKHNYIGATGVGLAVGSVINIIESYQKRFGRNIFFVDDNGEVVLKSSAMSGSVKNIKDDPFYRGVASEILSRDLNSLQYIRNGEAVLVNFRYIPELKWHLIVEQVENASLGEIKEVLYRNIFVCLFITIIVLVATNYTVNFYQQGLENMATTDKLTGLLNRQAFEIVFGQILKETTRNRQPLSLVIFDLDNFKYVNDTYGHIAGDVALSSMSSLIKATIRDSDVACRWGGDEFLLLFRDCDGKRAMTIAEKLRSNIAEEPVSTGESCFNVSITLGVAQYKDGENIDEILSRADTALLTAKQAGRNRALLSVQGPG